MKLWTVRYLRLAENVAPLAGAWIEIQSIVDAKMTGRSLPLRERGLKSPVPHLSHPKVWSLPLRERGLKWELTIKGTTGVKSLPLRERGLKLSTLLRILLISSSLPLRERGLKSSFYGLPKPEPESLPLRERGLKSLQYICSYQTSDVAPLAGAWIEISESNTIPSRYDRRSPCGSVD